MTYIEDLNSNYTKNDFADKFSKIDIVPKNLSQPI